MNVCVCVCRCDKPYLIESFKIPYFLSIFSWLEAGSSSEFFSGDPPYLKKRLKLFYSPFFLVQKEDKWVA